MMVRDRLRSVKWPSLLPLPVSGCQTMQACEGSPGVLPGDHRAVVAWGQRNPGRVLAAVQPIQHARCGEPHTAEAQEHPLLAGGAAALGVLVGHRVPVAAVAACVADLVAERARARAEVDAGPGEPEPDPAGDIAHEPLAVPRLVDVHD